MQAGGLDGIELEAYGHLLDSSGRPATNRRDDDYGGALDNRLRFTWRVLRAIRARVGPDFIVGCAWRRRGLGRASTRRTASRSLSGWWPSGQIDFLNVIRGTSRPTRR